MGNIIKYKPSLSIKEIHPDSEMTSEEFNKNFNEMKNDLNEINSEIIQGTNNFKNLLEETKKQLSLIKTNVITEKERLEDINVLCNRYNDFSNILTVSEKNCITDLSYENNSFSLSKKSSKYVKTEIVDIIGNGYEGNEYVYNNETFINKTNNTALRKYITDKSIITYYEYSRLTAENTEERISSLINFDSIFAKCAITLKSSEAFNILEIISEANDLILEDLSISDDGSNYKKCSINNVRINNKEDRFKTDDYIYGSGILSFKDSKYVKLLLKASSNTKDAIAFVKKNIDNEEEIIKLKTAKRSAVKINDIYLKKNIYSHGGTLTFKDFISDPVDSIAIFANEYCGDDLDLRESLKYTLTVNGISYEIIPINSNHNGKKIIRTTNHAIPAEYVHYINENIKNAKLTITFSSNKQYCTPYISNLKILLGGSEI